MHRCFYAQCDDPTCIEVQLDCREKEPIVSWRLTPLPSEMRGVFHRSGSTLNMGDISELPMMYARMHHSLLKCDAAGPL